MHISVIDASPKFGRQCAADSPAPECPAAAKRAPRGRAESRRAIRRARNSAETNQLTSVTGPSSDVRFGGKRTSIWVKETDEPQRLARNRGLGEWASEATSDYRSPLGVSPARGSSSTKCGIVSLIEINLRRFRFVVTFTRMRACCDGVPRCATSASKASNPALRKLATN
jgi:hypothetical protein